MQFNENPVLVPAAIARINAAVTPSQLALLKKIARRSWAGGVGYFLRDLSEGERTDLAVLESIKVGRHSFGIVFVHRRDGGKDMRPEHVYVNITHEGLSFMCSTVRELMESVSGPDACKHVKGHDLHLLDEGVESMWFSTGVLVGGGKSIAAFRHPYCTQWTIYLVQTERHELEICHGG
jgi:hypothetical protein